MVSNWQRQNLNVGSFTPEPVRTLMKVGFASSRGPYRGGTAQGTAVMSSRGQQEAERVCDGGRKGNKRNTEQSG